MKIKGYTTKRLTNPVTGEKINSVFIFKGDVIYSTSRLNWWERLIFWKKGIDWVDKRAFNRWLKWVGMAHV
jgi:hypothetical protein